MQNFSLIKKNNFYGEIQDMLDDEEISMNNKNHNSTVMGKLETMIKKAKFIKISDSVDNSKKLLEEIMIAITDENKENTMQGNTIFLYANENYSFQMIYLEDLTKEIGIDKMNEFATITNIELEPIYNDCAIIKIGYSDGKPENQILNINDICEIIINSFYHTGILIEEDGTMIDIIFSGDNPNKVLGGNFIRDNCYEILGLTIVPYIEKSDNINTTATKFMNMEIKGRVFITILCPISNKRFWSINKIIVNDVITIFQDNEKVNNIYIDIEKENKIINPFFLIKKYCII
jgi:hypothetical protein